MDFRSSSIAPKQPPVFLTDRDPGFVRVVKRDYVGPES